MNSKLPPCDHDECPPTHCKIATEPTPLYKAIERVSSEMEIHPTDFMTCSSFLDDIKQLLSAAKLLKDGPALLTTCWNVLLPEIEKTFTHKANLNAVRLERDEMEKELDDNGRVLLTLQTQRDTALAELSQLRSANAELEKERDGFEYMGNLLAIVHCDGGHHRTEHGSKKSTDDAIEIVTQLKVANEQLRADIKQCAEALNTIGFQLECPSRNTTISSYRRDGSVIISTDVRESVKLCISLPSVQQALKETPPNQPTP